MVGASVSCPNCTDLYTDAPAGQMWLCGACGKRSRNKSGTHAIDYGYDESCMLNSVLVYEASIRRNAAGRIVYADAVKEKP
jgi:hypothetical protein